uniref:Uncharacterized protein n=1 Tax=Anguilla anguilla TaxID=7936 RepID=A0A0E9R2D6_ANGAN
MAVKSAGVQASVQMSVLGGTHRIDQFRGPGGVHTVSLLL